MGKKLLPSLLLILLCICITPVNAFTGHGLEWGFTEGVRYNYTLNITSNLPGFEYDNEIFDCYYFFGEEELSFLSDVRENVTALSQIMGTDPFTLTNGTKATSMYAWFAFVPVGNWSLLTDLLPDFVPRLGHEGGTYEVIDTESSWGYLYSEDGFFPAVKWELGYIEHYEFSKADGTLSYHFRQSIGVSPAANLTVEVIKTESSGLLGIDIGLYVIGASIVALIVIVLVFNKRK